MIISILILIALMSTGVYIAGRFWLEDTGIVGIMVAMISGYFLVLILIVNVWRMCL